MMSNKCSEQAHSILRNSQAAWAEGCSRHSVWHDAGLDTAQCVRCGSTVARQLPGPWMRGGYWTLHERELDRVARELATSDTEPCGVR